MTACAITLIMCTRNRSDKLRPALDSLSELSFGSPWEAIVVDNGSRDDTPAVLREFAQNCNFTLRIVDEAAPGLSRARNRGLAFARGEIVAFTDDDCYPAPDYLAAIMRCFAANDVAYCGGRVLLYDQSDRRVTIQESNVERDLPPYSFIKAGWIHGANMAFRRTKLLRLGGFDERLGAGTPYKSGEDTDVLRRFSAAGLRGVYDPSAVVLHHHGRKTRTEEEKLLAGYSLGVGACMMKYCLHKPTRSIYLRRWYWRLRQSPYRRACRELLAGVRFWLTYGPAPSGVFPHPRDSLAPKKDMEEAVNTRRRRA